MKKLISLLITAAMTIQFAPLSFAAATTYTDIDGHWASVQIQRWSEKEILKGHEGKFRPNDPVTRGELAVILDRLMEFQVKGTGKFSDLDTNFYTEAILKANAAGVILGDDRGRVLPRANITRQDAAVMISRAFGTLSGQTASPKAVDAAQISSYAKNAVASLEALGFIQGREDGRFDPKATITRAEIVKIIDNIVKAFYTKSGTCSENIEGWALVNAPEVILKDMTIKGSLVIAPGVAQGNLTLDSVRVTGNVILMGGGENSVKFIGGSEITGTVIVKKIGSAVRLFTEKGVEIPSVIIDDGCDDVIFEGAFDNIEVNAENITISIATGSVVSFMTVNTTGINIKNAGTITALGLERPTIVTGAESIGKAILTAEANGSSFDKQPMGFAAPTGTLVLIAGQKMIWNGTGFAADTGTAGSGPGSVAVAVISVILSTSTGEMTVTPSGGVATFDLTALGNGVIINGIRITTNSASAYNVAGDSIDTNAFVTMGYFLDLAGISHIDVTLERLRLLGSSFSVDGDIGGGSSLKVVFNVKSTSASHYSFNMTGTSLTAALINDAAISASLMAGHDPVVALVNHLSDQTTTYTMKIKKGGLEITQGPYSYSQLSSFDLQKVVDKMKTNNFQNLVNLSDLSGTQITISSTTDSIKLIFS